MRYEASLHTARPYGRCYSTAGIVPVNVPSSEMFPGWEEGQHDCAANAGRHRTTAAPKQAPRDFLERRVRPLTRIDRGALRQLGFPEEPELGLLMRMPAASAPLDIESRSREPMYTCKVRPFARGADVRIARVRKAWR
jgi:hypothetical protein